VERSAHACLFMIWVGILVDLNEWKQVNDSYFIQLRNNHSGESTVPFIDF
jgi:hypothetical protein